MILTSDEERRRLRGRPVTRRALLAALGAGTALAATGCRVISGGAGGSDAAVGLSKQPAPGREVNIEWYNTFGSATGRGMVQLATAFEKLQNRIGVKVTYAPQATADVQARLLTALAAGDPPDVGFVLPEGSTQLSSYGVMTDLAPLMARDGFGADDLIAPVWSQMVDGDHVWNLRCMLDVNFPMFWNKGLFERSGLDPDDGPRTVDDIDRLSRKLNKRTGNQVSTIGATPWACYGYSNSMFTWGFAFGGKFLSDDGQQVTADHPNNVTALQWMCDYANSVGGANRVAVAPPGSNLPSIALDHVGMAPLVSPEAKLMRSVAPDIQLGHGYLPYAEGLGSAGSGTWLGGWGVFIPTKAKHPEAAWEFIKWLCLSQDGTLASYRLGKNVPSLRSTPALGELAKDPILSPYLDVLGKATNVRPNIPITALLTTEMENTVATAVYGQQSPKAALTQISDVANRAWDKFRKENQ